LKVIQINLKRHIHPTNAKYILRKHTQSENYINTLNMYKDKYIEL